MLKFFKLLLGISIVCSSLDAATADLLIFSKDRPLQLQAFLESVDTYITGLQKIAVLCHTKNDRFYVAYKKLEATFPKIQFVYQSRNNPRQDFLPLLKEIFNSMSSPYFTFGVDDTIVTDHIDLPLCINMMEQTNSYAFYPYMGQDITRCYMTNTQKLPPPLEDVGKGFYTWDLKAGVGPWGYIHSVYMTIFSRKNIESVLQKIHAQSPNTFEEQWGGSAAMHSQMKGLCYKTSHIINIPLNLVQYDCPQNNCSHKYTIEQLLNFFEKGWRIDIAAFYQLKHNAPHTDTDIVLTKQPLRF
jgi:hypothetical protein